MSTDKILPGQVTQLTHDEMLSALSDSRRLPSKFLEPSPLRISCVLVHPNAKKPMRVTPGSSGWDLYACSDGELAFQRNVTLDIGVVFEVPFGYEGQVRGRSGMTKRGIVTCGGIGTCDSDFRGSVGVTLSWPTLPMDYAYHPAITPRYSWSAGDRIAQLVIKRVPVVELVEVESVDMLSKTDRADKGFGSSGVR